MKPVPLGQGSLLVTARPRGGDWLRDELASFGVNIVVSLLTSPEMEELELEQEAHHCEELGIEFFHFPIVDRSVPSDRESFLALACQLGTRVAQGSQALLHCRAGLGRAPLMACAILRSRGMDVERAWRLVEEHRSREVPDTPEQRQWLGQCDSFEEALRRAGL